MTIAPPKSIHEDKIPRKVHIWDIDGFVKHSDKARATFKKLIKEYGLGQLARELNFDSETIFSLYNQGRKKGAHSQKAIRCWKKNKLIKRISWNKYEIL